MHATGCTDFDSTTVNPVSEFQFRVLNENVVNCQYAGFQGVIKKKKKVGPASRSTIVLVLVGARVQRLTRGPVWCGLDWPVCMLVRLFK